MIPQSRGGMISATGEADRPPVKPGPSFGDTGIRQARDHAGDGAPDGPFKMPAWPVRIDGKPPRLAPSPLLGQHNADVLSAWLGLGAADVAALKSEGVL